MRFLKSFDLFIAVPTALLVTLGLIALSSIDASLLRNQILFVLIGTFAFLLLSWVNIRPLSYFAPLFYGVSLALLLLPIFFGAEVRGAQRWIELFGATFQPTEIVKPMLIVAFASFLASSQGLTTRRLFVSLVLFAPIVILLFRQPDLGNALVFAITFVFMLFVAGMQLKYILIGLLLFGISFPIFWNVLAQYQKNRLLSFLNPGSDPLGIGYNAIQSMIAVGSGLLFGRGLGRGVQSQLMFLPERHTDFIFASLSEELGFIGSLAVILLYFLLLWRILKTAWERDDPFLSFVAFGAAMLFLSQVFINIGMNLALVPITGVTLPLISYGGSSLVSTMAILGIVHAIRRGVKHKTEALEIR